MRKINKIACIGEVMIELVPQLGDQSQMNVAGDTYNTAVYLTRLLEGTGKQVSYVTALGRDKFSDRVLADMAQHEIAADYVERRADKVVGLYAIDTDATGERSFTYWRSDSAARTLFTEPTQVGLETLMNFDLVFLSGITLAILPDQSRRSLFKALDAFRKTGGLVAYDSNHRPKLWASVEVARQVNVDMWARTDIALPSMDDEIALFVDRSEADALARVRSYGLRQGAMKRGPAGPIAINPEVGTPKFDMIETVVDTTAAGDSFNAGFLAGITTGMETGHAMRLGHAVASKVIQHPGAIAPRDAVHREMFA